METDEIKEISGSIRYDAEGLVPAVAQDCRSGQVLMLAWMNREAVEVTLHEQRACYYSRSRQKLWRKGETSGHVQQLRGFYIDCDRDAVLIEVEQSGPACHTGAKSCFFNTVCQEATKGTDVLDQLYQRVMSRREAPAEDSYTSYLFDKGLDKILKKVGEEASEVIIAAKNKSKDEVIYELSDLAYHLTVLMANEGVTPDDVRQELSRRAQ